MGALTSIEFAPLLPWPGLAALGGAAWVLVVYALWRRAGGTGWRALALAAGLLALANPSLVSEERDPLADVAVVVVDASASQRIGDRAEQANAALDEVRARLDGMSGLDVREVTVSREKSGIATATDSGTRLFDALERALADTPEGRVAGAILITDGQVHDVPADADAAALAGPVHVLLTGRQGERDRRLVIAQAPKYGIVGDRLGLTLRVEDPGGDGDRRIVAVTVRQDGGARQRHLVPLGVDREIPFLLEHGGANVLEIEAEAGPDELTLQNNRAVVVVNGVRDRLRVLLVSGEPYPGERAWRNLLKADPSVDLVHFTILRPPEKQDGTPVNELSLIAFPTRELFEVKLHEFDLIVFDRYRRRGVLPRIYLENIAGYVEAGGAVLEAAGPAFAGALSLARTPLGEVLPAQPTGNVIQQGFRPGLTGDGRRHPVTAELPNGLAEPPTWGRWFRMIEARAERGDVLMNGIDQRPMLILDRVGEGRVAQLLSDHGWLWARGFEGGGPQAELLRRIAHWLMKEPDLEEDDLRVVNRGDRLEIERRSLKPTDRPVTVTSPSGARQQLRLEEGERGRASATWQAGEPGLYQIDDGVHRTVAAVGALNPREYADVRASARPLVPVVEATGGGLHWLAADGMHWIALRANGEYLVTGVEQVPLLPALLVFVLVIGGLMLAWRREGA
jgi:hypothetical protein